MQLSPHFSLASATFSQTAVRRDIYNAPDADTLKRMKETAARMEEVRKLLGDKPIFVSSWYRSPELNRAVGGSSSSAHVLGWAVDFTCPDYGTPLDICRHLIPLLPSFDQLIYEGAWVHLSFAPTLRRQVLTAHFSGGGVTYTQGV